MAPIEISVRQPKPSARIGIYPGHSVILPCMTTALVRLNIK